MNEILLESRHGADLLEAYKELMNDMSEVITLNDLKDMDSQDVKLLHDLIKFMDVAMQSTIFVIETVGSIDRSQDKLLSEVRELKAKL